MEGQVRLQLTVLLAFAAIISTIKCNPADIKPCSDPNEIKVCDDNFSHCFCRPCLTCPPSYGQNRECDGIIKKSEKLKCTPCVLGVTYSDTNSSAVCHPCPHCDGFKVLHKCTLTTPTECSEDVCAEGYVLNDDMDHLKTCDKKPTPSTPRTKETEPKDNGTKPTTSSGGTLQVATMYDDALKTNPTKHFGQHQESTSHDQTTKIVVIAILVIVVAAIITVLFVKRKKICKYFRKRVKKDDSSSPENLPLNPVPGGSSSEPSPELPRQAYPWPADLLLKSIEHDLCSKIQTRLSDPKQRNGLQALGKELKLDEETILEINNHHQPEKGHQLFEALKTEKPKLTFTAFADSLVKLKRIDIVEEAKDYYLDKKVNEVDVEES